MSEINYISRHLLSKIKDIDLKLSTKSKEIISRKTSEITKHLTRFEDLKFKKYNELKLGYDYLLEENDIDIKLGKSISTFENTTEILSKLNKKTVIQLLLKKSDGFEDACLNLISLALFSTSFIVAELFSLNEFI